MYLLILAKSVLNLKHCDLQASYNGDDGVGTFGSFPKGFGYGPEENESEPQLSAADPVHKPRILLMGLRR